MTEQHLMNTYTDCHMAVFGLFFATSAAVDYSVRPKTGEWTHAQTIQLIVFPCRRHHYRRHL